MSAFDALMLGQKKAQMREKRKKPFECKTCRARFVNAGALATHSKTHPKFKGASEAEPQSNLARLLADRKLQKKSHPPQNFENSQNSEKSQKSSSSQQEANSSDDQFSEKESKESRPQVKSRARPSNLKKYRLLLHWEELKQTNPDTHTDDWEVCLDDFYGTLYND